MDGSAEPAVPVMGGEFRKARLANVSFVPPPPTPPVPDPVPLPVPEPDPSSTEICWRFAELS